MCAIKRIVIGVAFLLPSLSAQSADLNFDPIVVQVWQLSKQADQVIVDCNARDGAGQPINDVTYASAANSANPPVGNLDASKNFSGTTP